MKKFIYILFLTITPILCAQNNSKQEKTSFKVSGNCEMCKMRIEKAALSVKGVKYAKWNIPENQLTLVYNSNKVELIEIHNSIAQSGHDTSDIAAPLEIYNHLPICCLYIRDKNNKAPLK